VQGELLTADGLRPKSKRGGIRPGAGRPPKGPRSSSPHKRRTSFKPSVPIHVVLRVEASIGNLRRRSIYLAIQGATQVVAKRSDIRLVHVSIQRTHLHLIVESDDRLALAKGMQAFQVSAARRINRAMRVEGQEPRRGRVFVDRYHAELITSPRQARHVLAYVLNNWRKHAEDEREERARDWLVDPFSTGALFDGWKERAQIPAWPDGYVSLLVHAPRTWLLTRGWAMHGPISCLAVPAATARTRR
jgi:REP element-mobilizing transposase RayT